MRRKQILSLGAVLSVVLIVSAVFASGMIDVSRFPLYSAPAASESSASVFVDPVKVLDQTKQSGSLVTFHVNVSAATDLFAWQINVTCNPLILNVNKIYYGEFLNRTTSENKTAAYELGFVINSTDNVKGYTGMSESILGDVSGITGNGRLVSIEFLVVGYGSTDLAISLTGNLGTTLLNSTYNVHHETISFTKTDGYFSNKILGDVNGDGIVDGLDFSLMGGAYRATPGSGNWNSECDINRDGIVDGLDFSIAGGNYRKHI